MLYRLRAGSHKQGGKRYKKGDIVDTTFDLCSMFRNKFEVVHEDLNDTGTEEETKRGKKPNIPPPVDKGKDKAEDKVVDKGTKSKSLSTLYGEEVTSGFPTAEKVKVRVFEKLRWYMIIDCDDDEVLNEKKLRKKEIEPFLEQYLEADEEEDEDED